MQFTELFEKLKFKILAPATILYRQLGYERSEFKFCSWLPAWTVFAGEPIDKKTKYYKTVYINGKRIKPYTIIPRHAFIEIRQKPKGIIALFTTILSTILTNTTIGFVAAKIIAGVATALVVGGAAAAVGAGASALLGARKSGGSGTTSTPSYSSNESPSLTGAKNETLEKQVPIVIGRTFQVFNYAQYTTPFVQSGYAGNRYRVYSIPTYKNVNFYDFKLGTKSITNYKSSAYDISEAHGVSNFIGWDNAQTDRFNNKELSFDQSQAVFYSAIAYYNQECSGTTLKINQKYYFKNVVIGKWTPKVMNIEVIFISEGVQVTLAHQLTINSSDLIIVSGTTNEYTANKTITIDLGNYNISEFLRTTVHPDSSTRGSGEDNLLCYLDEENIIVGNTTYLPVDFTRQSVDGYSGDRVEVLSQSPTRSKWGDIHFSFPQGLYRINKNTAARERTTIQAEITWKRVDEVEWRGVDDDGISQIYVRDIDGVVHPAQSPTTISSRVTRNGNVFTFKTPDDINYANNNFFECVGFEFAQEGHYILNMQPVVFQKDNYYTGTICIADVVWRLSDSIPVVDSKMLPSVSQVACTFNATTQLEGDVDELGCVSFAKVKNLETGNIEESRNPVDIIYYLLTDADSNPRPMSENRIDMPSFLKARKWCASHECKTDGIINEEVKYFNVIDEICNNNQLYLIPNKWGKIVLRVDTNEDNRPIKTFFNAENSWDLSISRTRGKIGRLLAIRASYIDEETWSEQEVTGYWYGGQCNWQPEEGKDDLYYQPEKRDLNYVRNIDAVKRRIAYELEIANEKNTIAEFYVAREVLDLEVLDRVLVADYTRIKNAITGTVDEVLEENGMVIGIRTSQPFEVTQNMTMTIRSVDTSGQGDNVKLYKLKSNNIKTSYVLFENPIPKAQCNIRTSGFYNVDGQEFYYSGDLYMAGTAEILNMVVKTIEEVSGDDFTSKITCRTY